MREPDGVAYVPSMLACAQAGTIVSDQYVLVGYVPVETTGLLLRAANLSVSVRQEASATDYWNLQYGLWSPGKFQVLAVHSLSDGLSASGARLPFENDVRVPRGFTFALRAVKRGDPAPLEGLSAAFEYGILGAR